jgi:hypothetical protein
MNALGKKALKTNKFQFIEEVLATMQVEANLPQRHIGGTRRSHWRYPYLCRSNRLLEVPFEKVSSFKVDNPDDACFGRRVGTGGVRL